MNSSAYVRATFQETVLNNPYQPLKDEWVDVGGKKEHVLCPAPKQAEFLSYLGLEAMYGGAAAGGKSRALIMAALQYVQVPDYRAMLIRRTFRQLHADKGLIREFHSTLKEKGFLGGKGGVHWSAEHARLTFPSGATISFGYLDHEKDKDNYQGPGWHFIGVDELTQFPKDFYTFLFSRLRREKGCKIPLRIRSATNPGRIGHQWVKQRFLPHRIGEARRGAKHFVKALLSDNPGIDADEYLKSLNELDIITRNQMLAGDWSEYEGGRFRSRWFKTWSKQFDVLRGQERYFLEGRNPAGYNVNDCWVFGTCDPACTEDEANDPTAIGMFAVTPEKDLMVLEVVRDHMALENIVPRMADLAAKWRPLWIGIEGTGFQEAIVTEARKFPRLPTIRKLETKNRGKLVRATPAINRAHDGQIFIPEQGPQKEKAWIEEFVAELTAFTGDEDLDSHDDQVDVLAWAVLSLDEYGLSEPVAVNFDDQGTDREYSDDDDQRPSVFNFGSRGKTGWGGRLSSFGRG